MSILVLFGVGGTLYAYSQQAPSEPSNLSEIEEENVPPQGESNTPSNLPIKDGAGSGVTDRQENIVQGDIETPNLTRAEQRGAGTIRVVAILQMQTSGYCRVNITNENGETFNENVQINVGSNYYSCSIDITDARLSTTSSWTVTVDHILNGVFATSNSRTVIVN